jgi:hypothetical protein
MVAESLLPPASEPLPCAAWRRPGTDHPARPRAVFQLSYVCGQGRHEVLLHERLVNPAELLGNLAQPLGPK